MTGQGIMGLLMAGWTTIKGGRVACVGVLAAALNEAGLESPQHRVTQACKGVCAVCCVQAPW
jgi:hypothetical protein